MNRIRFIWKIKVDYQIINPKAVTISELYGHFNPFTNEWYDGIFSGIFRKHMKVNTIRKL